MRFPAAHIHDGEEVDPRHGASRCPVVAPFMDGEILYSRALAGGGVLVLDRIAAGNLRLAGVRIGVTEPVEENMPRCWLTPLLPDRAQHVLSRWTGHENAEDVIQQVFSRMAGRRSEEHTSELQSLMRISYAVFCLKKKKNKREKKASIINDSVTTHKHIYS